MPVNPAALVAEVADVALVALVALPDNAPTKVVAVITPAAPSIVMATPTCKVDCGLVVPIPILD